MAAVTQETQDSLAGISIGNPDVLETAVELREDLRAQTGLDARTFALAKIAALIALDAPPASYAWQVPNALAGGATADDLLGVLKAVAPQVGGPRGVPGPPGGGAGGGSGGPGDYWGPRAVPAGRGERGGRGRGKGGEVGPPIERRP